MCGSTLCIQAMLRLVAREGGKVIAGRNIHAAAVNAMALLGLEPVWVYPQRYTEERLIGRIAPEDVAAVLERESNVCAVYITSPDYFGVMSDIEGIAEVAHAHGVPLLVDNAHGAHLRFLRGECDQRPPRSPRIEKKWTKWTKNVLFVLTKIHLKRIISIFATS